jgi:hypothetical protein
MVIFSSFRFINSHLKPKGYVPVPYIAHPVSYSMAGRFGT